MLCCFPGILFNLQIWQKNNFGVITGETWNNHGMKYDVIYLMPFDNIETNLTKLSDLEWGAVTHTYVWAHGLLPGIGLGVGMGEKSHTQWVILNMHQAAQYLSIKPSINVSLMRFHLINGMRSWVSLVCILIEAHWDIMPTSCVLTVSSHIWFRSHIPLTVHKNMTMKLLPVYYSQKGLVKRGFDVSIVDILNKLLSKQPSW